MEKKERHLSDEDLLLAADGELAAKEAAFVRDHLTACSECRARMSEVQTTIVDFAKASRRAFNARLPLIDGPRARLKARLAETERLTRQDRWWQPPLFHGYRVAYILGLILVLTGGARILSERKSPGDSKIANVYDQPLPNPKLTPGSIRSATLAEICSTDHDEVVRAVPGPLQQRVFQEYGIAGAPVKDYEVDYLITPGLGGAEDIRNLWPEPHTRTVWNSYVKDQLEDHLHQLVCGRRISLEVAQQEIASNWISAYKKFFGTDQPLPGDFIAEIRVASTRERVRTTVFSYSIQPVAGTSNNGG
jgi:Putative zinc-finger